MFARPNRESTDLAPRIMLSTLVGAVVVGLALITLWIMPVWLTEHPHIADPAERQKAIADARTGMVTFLAFIGAFGGLYYTSRTFRQGQESLRHTSETLRLGERGQITDRYSRAVEQLGSEAVDVCIGGIYSLQRLIADCPTEEATIIHVLSAFVRREARLTHDGSIPCPARDRDRDPFKPSFRVQAALNVLARTMGRHSDASPDLRDSDLRRCSTQCCSASRLRHAPVAIGTCPSQRGPPPGRKLARRRSDACRPAGCQFGGGDPPGSLPS